MILEVAESAFFFFCIRRRNDDSIVIINHLSALGYNNLLKLPIQSLHGKADFADPPEKSPRIQRG